MAILNNPPEPEAEEEPELEEPELEVATEDAEELATASKAPASKTSRKKA